MSPLGAGLAVGGGLLFLLLVALVTSYNRFVQQTTLVEESWSQVDVELQRRHDLIPNLVETVKGYAAHERSVLERVTAARVAADQHRRDSPPQRRPFEEEVGGALSGLMVVAEAYPDLKASITFLQLQRELTDTEDRIAAGRRFYNGNVRALNTRVGTFPSNVVAAMFGFDRSEFFELSDPAAATPPQVGPALTEETP
ncbi:LemA family protein [Nocardioides marmoribigeumensis]|uniref:LemA protein n=1 Tax=Nocardioides marmoribigeumensis TaxID=433649 RepID=A0ABU2BWQ4_9ACTN|nr:LemA family protein [Nocardioides marmoribigeumensis]MDR7362699.1 LemA protein [Nocardioides marmoribigeumensis]